MEVRPGCVDDRRTVRRPRYGQCRSCPVETCCCGLIPDSDKQIKDILPYLNKHFVPTANDKLKKHGLRIDAFLWWWHNLQGKSETTILLLRFFEADEEDTN